MGQSLPLAAEETAPSSGYERNAINAEHFESRAMNFYSLTRSYCIESGGSHT